MHGHAEQRKRRPGLPIVWRLILAFVGGLVLGMLGILLFGALGWRGLLVLLLSPLPTLLGVVGRLTVGLRTKRPDLGGLGMGGLSCFGAWLAILGWESFQPQTRPFDCFQTDPGVPCSPTTIPFWGDSAWFFLLVFVFFLGVELVYVVVSVVGTSIVLRQKAAKPESSQ
jgi:hypothetical protein